MPTWILNGKDISQVINCKKNEWFESTKMKHDIGLSSKIVIYPKGYKKNENLSIFLNVTSDRDDNSDQNSYQFAINCDYQNAQWQGNLLLHNKTGYVPLQPKFPFAIFNDNSLKSITFSWNIYNYSDNKQEDIKQSEQQITTNYNEFPIDSNKDFITFNWTITDSFKWVILSGSNTRAQSDLFTLFGYICQMICFSNQSKQITLHISTIKQTDNIGIFHMILLVDLYCIGLNKSYSTTVTLTTRHGQPGEMRSALFPTGFISCNEIKNVSNVTFVMRFKHMKTIYKAKSDANSELYFGPYTGKLHQIDNIKLKKDLVFNWKFKTNSKFWNMENWKWITSKRFNIWLLQCFPNGVYNESNKFNIGLKIVVFPQHVFLSPFIKIIEVKVSFLLKELNYKWEETVKFGDINQKNHVKFELTNSLKQRLFLFDQIEIECKIKVIALYDSNKRIDLNTHNVFVENENDLMKSKLNLLENKLKYYEVVIQKMQKYMNNKTKRSSPPPLTFNNNNNNINNMKFKNINDKSKSTKYKQSYI
eukprot:361022_1